MSLHISGVNVSLPLDLIGRVFAKIRFGDEPIKFLVGSKYQLNGEWFTVEQVLETGLVLRLVNHDANIEEIK